MKPTDDSDTPLSRWWTIPTLGSGLVVTAATSQIAPFALAEAVGMCTAVSFIVMVSIWHLRREQWFRPFLAVATALQVAAIWLIPWPPEHTFQKSDLNLLWIDYLILLATGFIIERLVGRNDANTNGS